MHTGRSCSTFEFLLWTRRSTYTLVLLGILPVVLYQIVGLKWLSVTWTVVAPLGAATAFIVGFQNVQAYNRVREGRQIWGEIAGSSRAWGAMSRDFLNDPETSKQLIYRHLAWLTAMRYQMRGGRAWETLAKRTMQSIDEPIRFREGKSTGRGAGEIPVREGVKARSNSNKHSDSNRRPAKQNSNGTFR